MARKTQSRLELRKQAEAAESQGAAPEGATKKKKREKDPTKKPARRAKSKVAERRRLMWAVFNGSMKEEGRFPYDGRDSGRRKGLAAQTQIAQENLLYPGHQRDHHGPAQNRGSRREVNSPASDSRPFPADFFVRRRVVPFRFGPLRNESPRSIPGVFPFIHGAPFTGPQSEAIRGPADFFVSCPGRQPQEASPPLSPATRPSSLVARLFVVFAPPHLFFNSRVLNQLSEPLHRIRNRFMLTQAQLDHKVLPLWN